MTEAQPQQPTRFGYVALLGRPNVGKSTLVNQVVGSKVTIVSRRPQTTRHRILGVATRGAAQAALVDTPGVQADATRLLNRTMSRAALGSLDDADLGVFLLEGTGFRDEDQRVLKRLMRRGRSKTLSWICCLTKTDLVRPRQRLLKLMSELAEIHPWQAILPISARKGWGVDELWQLIQAELPEGPHLFANDQASDRPVRFLAAELIREQLMRQLGDEVPHRAAVVIERLDEEARLVRLAASILVEREGQKAIVIGSEGRRLKSVGSKARGQLETLFERKVVLNLWVKVQPNWSNSATAVRVLGYDES